MTKDEVKDFFMRYEQLFMQSLNGEIDTDELSSLYAQEFIAASPLGVMAGKNDNIFISTLAQGYEQYRKIGTQRMRVRDISISPIDEIHCVAHVAWTATYSVSENLILKLISTYTTLCKSWIMNFTYLAGYRVMSRIYLRNMALFDFRSFIVLNGGRRTGS